jgi:dihydrofolate reductase
MTKIILDITMSLDGYIAGPDITIEQPLGKNGPLLHDWLFSKKTDQDAIIIKAMTDRTGAVITGNHTYTTAIPGAWEGQSPFDVPVFVLAPNTPTDVVEGFTFVTDGIESALTKARTVAGDKDVWIMGGANVAQQYIKAGLLDELHIHIAPLLLGEGTKLFDDTQISLTMLEVVSNIQTPAATHLQYKVVR